MGGLGKEWPGRVVCLAAPAHQEIYCSEIVSFVLGPFSLPPCRFPPGLIPWQRFPVCPRLWDGFEAGVAGKEESSAFQMQVEIADRAESFVMLDTN